MQHYYICIYIYIYIYIYCFTPIFAHVHAAATHSLVAFIDEVDEPTCVVRTTRLKDCLSIIPGAECGVKWSDGNVYRAKVLALGKYVKTYKPFILNILTEHLVYL